MSVEELDATSGRKTTGHEWNGIKELDTPVPRGVLMFLVVTHVFALLWWVLMPTWPLGDTYTKGLLQTDQHKMVAQQLGAAQAFKASWLNRIQTATFAEVQADEALMAIVKRTGRQLFGDNCAACHGRDAKGGDNYPDLTDDDWIWGGGPEKIAETLRVGVNSPHAQSRTSQMPAFGRDNLLDASQVKSVASYVYSLSNPSFSTSKNIATIEAGREVFLGNCAACHGENAKGNAEMGAPNLTDGYWIYGGDLEKLVASIHGGRQGHMPTWDKRLNEADIKILALYVHALGLEKP